MRKLRLVAVIVFGAYGGHALYKYLSEEGKVFVSRVLLPESETVTNVAPKEVPVEVETKTSMDEYFEAHKNDIQEIIKKSLVEGPDSMEEYFQEHKNDVAENVKEKIKEKIEEIQSPVVQEIPTIDVEVLPEVKEIPEQKIEIYKKEIDKTPTKKGCCKHYKAKYCVKIDHSKDSESVNEIIMRHFQ